MEVNQSHVKMESVPAIPTSRMISVINVQLAFTIFLNVQVKYSLLTKLIHNCLDIFQYSTIVNYLDCECNLDGTVNGYCDPISGKCFCKDKVDGNNCDICKKGHFQFPACNSKIKT